MKKEDLLDFRSFAEKSLDFIEAISREAYMQHDGRVRAALRVIAANPGDRQTVEEVTRETVDLITRTQGFKRALRNRSPFRTPPVSALKGPIVLGSTYNPVLGRWMIVGLYPGELQQFMLIVGRSGAGKTNLVFVLVNSLLRMGIPFWALDFKIDYRHLLRATQDLLIFNDRTFKFNPLRCPPGCNPFKWLQTFCDIFCEVFFPGTSSASKNLLLTLGDELYRSFGVYDGSDRFPTLLDLDAALETGNSEKKLASQEVQQRLTCCNKTMPLVRLMGSMLQDDPEFPLDELLERNVVFELQGLRSEYQEWLVNMLLFWVFMYRIENGQRGALRHVMIFDEAKMVYGQDRATPGSSRTQVTCMAREFGEGLIISDQIPSSLSDAIKANVFVTTAMNLSSTKDVQATAHGMGLDDDQRGMLMTIPVGNAVVRFAGRYPWPFILRIPCSPIVKNVTDAEVERHMAPLLADLASRASARQHADSAARHAGFVNEPPHEESPLPEPKADGPEEDETALTEMELSFLMDVKNRPFVRMVDRYRDLKMTNYKGNRISGILSEKGLVVETKVRLRPRTTEKYLRLTDKAEEAFGKQNLGPGKGGFEHVLYQQRLREHFMSLGWQAEIESYRNGKSADLGLSKDGQEIAVEVGMSLQGEIDNILKDHRAGWPRIWCVSPYPNILEQVRQQWLGQAASYPSCKVEFHMITDLLTDSKGPQDSAGPASGDEASDSD